MSEARADEALTMLGPVPDISSVNPNLKGNIYAAAFDLYRDAVGMTHVAGHLYSDENPNGALGREQAILAGLLMRIAKFMTSVMQLSDGQRDKREVVLVLNRCIVESVVNLRFLVEKADPKFFAQFVEFSLGPERELYDGIQKNIQARGSTLPIEERMLKSINRICRLSGMTIDQVRLKYGDWGGGVRERLKALDLQDAYAGFQRVPSHSVHGSWVDLLFHYLDESGDGFTPRSDPSEVDPRMWLPTALLVIDAVETYLSSCFPDFPELSGFLDRLSILRERIMAIDGLHEQWMSKKGAE